MVVQILLGDFSTVRGPVLVGVILVFILLRLQGDGLGSGGSCPLGGSGMNRGTLGFGGASVGLIVFIRGRGEVRTLLSATGPCRYRNILKLEPLFSID